MNPENKLNTSKDLIGELWIRSRRGDRAAFTELFEYRRELLVEEARRGLGMHLRRRLDASDVVQEVYLEATRRLAELAEVDIPQLVWLRVLLKQKVVDLKRMHLGAAKRSISREQSLENRISDVDSIADQLVTSLTSPSMKACRNELREQIRTLLDELSIVDRQILVLRHFEGKSNREVAEKLNLSINAASNRYVRAIKRFKCIHDASGTKLEE
ncbi:MAG: sigma-70 family RNA polymerase sigma factor [Pirellulaceae bacterium]